MAATESTMVALGTKAQDFTLLDTVSGKSKSLHVLSSEKGTLIMFICNHCPFVKHLNKALTEFSKEYLPKGLSIIAISSNDVHNYPDDSPEKMTQNAIDNNWDFPYLYDETQQVAKAYDAVCTPDFFLYNGNLELVYRGQFDSSRPSNGVPVTGDDLRNAVDALLSGDQISKEQTPSVGCNIKWKN